MRRTSTTAVTIALTLSAVLPALAQTPMPDPPSMSTQGLALIKVAPDIAWVSARVEARAGRPGEAQRKAAESMATVRNGLEATGVAAAALRTMSYVLQPEMEFAGGTSRIKGYVARNAIEIRVDDLATLGAVIDAAAASGAGTISGLRFDVKDREVVERQALAAAARDAMSRLRAMADGLGQTSGPVIRAQDHRVTGSAIMYHVGEPGVVAGGRGGGIAPPQTPVEPGEIEIRAQVTATVGVKGA